ncbi:DNA-directed RNA polymerase III complex subunit Rpc11 [Schizosaccharomyces octosporus yFS286]|uniref:DNA-directed RNA polymerase subunit n=2 Tax=Schizosaccharomyces TaxID=4895 RepID=S9VXE8_SCHCR|nr:DNA-directed RNA polymerase III complex subunit Rpc11 [Schizosaccharomyces octosporus yFS286]XP_013024252.1 DNA-directed RNA polymerase III complex subunit Rpc11 [Schizosaccharomyces cryophilus OY26]EPX74720.1 DNA-directed RNA polymerase III complex subunit Rpc11 [Schizosaccharomyces octosporus yFS286]EPY50839.1 DNA-directed RNA polymerase III complex subunit Rpc11 [Schizosaccharomyces cryophilus OY26]
MQFCPTCGNHLVIAIDEEGRNAFDCKTCPYQFPISALLYSRHEFPQKKIDDVLGGDEAFESNQQTEVACDNSKCDNNRAYFFQLQIRSADEPMSTFYRCTKCKFQWREN